MCSVTEGTSSCSGFPFNLLSLQPLLDAPWALQPLTPHSLLSSESKLVNIRKDILEQVQNECQSRSQQLITELTGFMKAFQTISSDIHSIAWCSQKVGFVPFLCMNAVMVLYLRVLTAAVSLLCKSQDLASQERLYFFLILFF